MNKQEALSYVSRYQPCPHDSGEKLGYGHWVKCQDCGATVPIESIGAAQDACKKFEQAMEVLRK